MTTGAPEGPVTILFADVEGSTDLRTRLGDVAAHQVLREHEDLLRTRFAEHGGREVKALGDGFMVVFASVRRALACATAIQQAVEEHGRRSPGRAVHVRIGLNTGEVVADGSDLYGQAVNAAARIAARAGAGDILVSEVTRQLAGSGPEFAFRDRGRVRLKGFPDRWHLYGLVWEPKGPVPAGGVASSMPCVGREAELEALGRLLEGARAGTTSLVVIEGEAGMGKSRLLEEVPALPASSGFSLHRARAEELQPRPFGLLADAMAIDARSSDPDRLAIAALLDADSNAAGEATDRRYRVTEGVINLVERAAMDGPVLAVFDDVHWADPSSLQALHVFCRRLAYLPVLIVLACRPLPRPPELARLVDGVIEAGGRHLTLGPLRDEAVGELATSKLAAHPGPVLRGRLQGAAGNPLFVLELLAALAEEGFIKVESDVAEAATAVEPPPSLRMTILRRLAFLSPESLDLLRTASLFGGSFSAAQLSVVTDQPLLHVLSRLEEPTTAGFVRASEEAFAFRHDVVREALYLEIPAAVRKGLHLHVGRALAASGSPPAEVAPHLALGAEPGDRDAVNWLAQAARQLRWQAPGLAVQLLERAAALLPEPGPEWISLVGEEISTLTLAGRVREANALVDDALSRVSDESLTLHLLMARLDLLTMQGRPRVLEDMVPRLLGARSVPERLRESILGFSAAARVALGDLEGAEARLAEAEATGNLASGNLAMWRAVRAIISWMQGRWRGATEEAAQAVAGLREPSSRHVQVQLWLGLFQVGADEFTEARTTLDRARAEAERLGFLSYMVEQHWQLAALHVAAGQWDDALAELATSLQLSEETGAIGSAAVLGAYYSPLIHLQRGNLGSARAALERIQREPSHDPTTAAGLWVHPLRALMEDGAGRPMVTADIVETWQDQVRKMTALPDYRGVGRALLRICRAQGRTELADRMVNDAAEACRRVDGIPSVDGTALLLQGMAEEDPGTLLTAVEAFRAAPRPFDRAEACAEAAISLLSRGRDGEGRALLDEAFDLYDELGASRPSAALAQEVRAYGVRRGVKGRRPRATTGWSALTATEERIVGLVAEGLTNAEIGDRLYISRGTVATHLRSVFRKLDVSSRAELAAGATRHLV